MKTQPYEDELPLGTHLVTERRGYSHHGIYIGGGKVVHYAGFCASLRCGPVEEISLERFASGHGFSVQLEPCARYIGMEAVQRALSRLGEETASTSALGACTASAAASKSNPACTIRRWACTSACAPHKRGLRPEFNEESPCQD